jgi:RNA polymerase sigma factor (sigma-70 family)
MLMVNDTDILDQYRGFVKRIAATAVKSSAAIDSEDLYQVGEMAVLRAVKSYDPTCGRNIKSWVCSIIRQDIYNEAARFLGIFTVDRRVTEMGAEASRLYNDGRSDSEIAEVLGKRISSRNFTPEIVKDLRLAYSRRHIAAIAEDASLDLADETSIEDLLYSIIRSDVERSILELRILGGASLEDLSQSLLISKSTLSKLEAALRERICETIRGIV